MNARDEFYVTLGENLTQKGRQSVLYRYLEEEQERKAANADPKTIDNARSYQLRLRYYRSRLREGELSPEEYIGRLLALLLQKPKFCKQCGKPEKSLESRKRIGYQSMNPEPYLEELLDTVLGYDRTEGNDNKTQDMQRAAALLNAKDTAAATRLREAHFPEEPYTKLMLLTDAVLDVAVAYDIKEFFFGTVVETLEEYPVSKRQKSPDKTLTGSRPERTDKSLKLIEYYCRKEGKTLFGSGADVIREVHDTECDALYRKLLESGNEQVFVPLLVDGETGCGIYIIGRSYFEGSEDLQGLAKEKDKCCAYGVIFFDNDSGEGVRSGYHINNPFCEFSCFNEARFRGDWSYEQARQDAIDMMREINGKMPEGVSDAFRKYFEEVEDRQQAQDEQEIRRAVAGYEKAFREKEQRRHN